MRIERLISKTLLATSLVLAMLCLPAFAQLVLTPQEKALVGRINHLRSLSHDQRVTETLNLALAIRELHAGTAKVMLATGLGALSTEGDFGHDTLQQVANTLADALQEQPIPPTRNGPAEPYLELADLARYEHVDVTLQSPQYSAAMAQLADNDKRRADADFTLTDIDGQRWSLRALRGKVVVVNFWATWCPPCRSEMPDLQALYQQFKPQGLVILGISGETSGKVKPFVTQQGITYPILLDPGDKVSKQFRIDGIPHTFIYDREGHLAAQAMDMRTRQQFLAMLAQAGVK